MYSKFWNFAKKIFKEIIIIIFFLILSIIILSNPLVRPTEIESKNSLSKNFWSISKREHKLVLGLTGHTFLELRDENNNVISQIHGLAADQYGNYQEVGNNKDYKLKVFVFDYDRYKIDKQKEIGNVSAQLVEGTQTEMRNYWEKAKVCGDEINQKDINYPILGFKIIGETDNSNSVTDTIVECMGLKNRDIGLFTPGRNNNLLKN